jgi:hypothetical protein
MSDQPIGPLGSFIVIGKPVTIAKRLMAAVSVTRSGGYPPWPMARSGDGCIVDCRGGTLAVVTDGLEREVRRLREMRCIDTAMFAPGKVALRVGDVFVPQGRNRGVARGRGRVDQWTTKTGQVRLIASPSRP